MPTERTVDFHVRADAPVVKRREFVVDRLARAVRRGRIAEFDVNVWPRAISLDASRDDEVYETVRSFERWAIRHGRRIRPAFDVRTVHSAIVDETDDRLVLPVLCVAARLDGTSSLSRPVAREGRRSPSRTSSTPSRPGR